MKFVLITKDDAIGSAARAAFPPGDALLVFESWEDALDSAEGADLIFVDQIATLREPHKVAGYEAFATAKMAHEKASKVPLVLIAPPPEYEMDSVVGWPDFVFAHVRHPITDKTFRRAATWV